MLRIAAFMLFVVAACTNSGCIEARRRNLQFARQLNNSGLTIWSLSIPI
jgi:hypothetical protein